MVNRVHENDWLPLINKIVQGKVFLVIVVCKIFVPIWNSLYNPQLILRGLHLSLDLSCSTPYLFSFCRWFRRSVLNLSQVRILILQMFCWNHLSRLIRHKICISLSWNIGLGIWVLHARDNALILHSSWNRISLVCNHLSRPSSCIHIVLLRKHRRVVLCRTNVPISSHFVLKWRYEGRRTICRKVRSIRKRMIAWEHQRWLLLIFRYALYKIWSRYLLIWLNISEVLESCKMWIWRLLAGLFS